MENKKYIDSFDLEYDFLSNFYPACLEFEGLEYLNSESAYQAAKCKNDEDKLQFTALPPNVAKRLGRQICVREDWDEVKFSIMERIVRAKFTQNPHLALYLVETEDAELMEGNTWNDIYWGVHLKNHEGQNNLGKILMNLRAEFQKNGLPEDNKSKVKVKSEKSEEGITVLYQDITQIDCDCIVNPTTSTLLSDNGVSYGICRASGAELLKELKQLNGCEVAQVKLTGAYRLPIKYIIHTVGPIYKQNKIEESNALLRVTYQNILELAKEKECHSIALTAISTERNHYPKKLATEIAVESVRAWQKENPEYEMKFFFSCLDLTIYEHFCEELKKERRNEYVTSYQTF